MPSPSLSLSGPWTGVYDHNNSAQEAVSFTADLTDIAGAVWGDIEEPNSFSPTAAKVLAASVSGMRSGYEVTFEKTYIGEVPGGEFPVFYAGTMSRNGQRISGTWKIRGPWPASGPFVMNRIKGQAVSRVLALETEAER